MTSTTFESTAAPFVVAGGSANVSEASPSSWETLAARLVAERGDSLTRYAYFLSGSHDDAADLVQDALVKTFGRLRNGHTITSAEAYVRRAILTTFLDEGRRRSRWRRVAHLTAAPEFVEVEDRETDTQLDLTAQLQRLTPRERACIVLRYYDDLLVDDIASQLRISSGAVKRYVSDGLAKLKVSIDPKGGSDDHRG